MATVLFCDDNPRIQKLFAIAFRPSGHRTLVAASGEEALRLAESERPDIVITDYAMPGMDGIELLRKLRAHPDLSATPVVILSASTDAERRREAIEAGAAAFLGKPFSADEVLATIDDVLSTRHGN